MSRSIKKRWTLFGAVIGIGTTLSLVVGLGVFAGAGTAASSAVPKNTSPPTVTGTAQVGKRLAGDRGRWSNNPGDYNYFWVRCDKNGGSCANISGAHAASYLLGSADLGNTLRFKVQATNTDGSTFASSVPTAVVVAATVAPPPPPGDGVSEWYGCCAGDWCVVAGAAVDRSAAVQPVGRRARDLAADRALPRLRLRGPLGTGRIGVCDGYAVQPAVGPARGDD